MKAMSHVRGHSNLSLELSHYYHTPMHAHFHASKALPFIRSVSALKSMNCFEEGIPELDPRNDHHHEDDHH